MPPKGTDDAHISGQVSTTSDPFLQLRGGLSSCATAYRVLLTLCTYSLCTVYGARLLRYFPQYSGWNQSGLRLVSSAIEVLHRCPHSPHCYSGRVLRIGYLSRWMSSRLSLTQSIMAMSSACCSTWVIKTVLQTFLAVCWPLQLSLQTAPMLEGRNSLV